MGGRRSCPSLIMHLASIMMELWPKKKSNFGQIFNLSKKWGEWSTVMSFAGEIDGLFLKLLIATTLFDMCVCVCVHVCVWCGEGEGVS